MFFEFNSQNIPVCESISLASLTVWNDLSTQPQVFLSSKHLLFFKAKLKYHYLTTSASCSIQLLEAKRMSYSPWYYSQSRLHHTFPINILHESLGITLSLNSCLPLEQHLVPPLELTQYSPRKEKGIIWLGNLVTRAGHAGPTYPFGIVARIQSTFQGPQKIFLIL